MPEEWCKCGRPLRSERNLRLELCRICEGQEELKKLEDTVEFLEKQPTLRYEDGLTYVIEPQPEFDD